MVGTTKVFAAFACCFAVLVASASYGHGTLSTNPNVLFGGGPDAGYWRGQVAYDNGMGLTGHLDFGVFTAAAFNADYSGLGYVPTNAVVYAYQVYNEGADATSAQIIGLANPAETIGTFNIGDVDASFMDLLSGSYAEWDFLPGIGTGESSFGLAFSSPNLPEYGVGLTIDGGFGALEIGVPTPGPNAIPEPASVVLLSMAGIAALGFRRWVK